MTTPKEGVGDSQRGGVDDECSTTGTFKCDTCGRKFEHKKDLLHHTYIHKENPKYDCQVCGKILTSKVGYDRHMGTHAKDKKNTVYCKICHQECPSKTKLEEHHRQNHLEQKPFACEICKAEFSWEENLHKHRRMHLDENYQCKLCKKVFVDTISLKVHMRNHNQKKNAADNLKPYGCTLCGQRFQYDFSFSAHKRLHDAGLVENKERLKESVKKNTKEMDDSLSTPEESESENSEPYKTFLGKRSVHLKKKTADKLQSRGIKAIDPELQNAKILPAFETPKGYKPYPQIRGLSNTGKIPTNERTGDSADYRKKSTKAKNTALSKEKKAVNKRFGDLSMTEETPYRCSYCEKQFRWEVSLKVHIDEHVNGTKKLTDAELRRQRRFAAEKKIKRQLAQSLRAAKNTISPKKSRLVKRKAGSDDEDSEEENFSQGQGTSPTKEKQHPVGQNKHRKSTNQARTYSRSSDENQCESPVQMKALRIEPQTYLDNRGHVSETANQESPPVCQGRIVHGTQENQADTTQTETSSPALDNELIEGSGPERTHYSIDTNNAQYSYGPVAGESALVIDQGLMSNQVLENVTNTGENRSEIHAPAKKRPKVKTSKPDAVRRSRRLAGDDAAHFDTINAAQVLGKCDERPTDCVVAVSDNDHSAGSERQLTYTAYESARDYNNYSENVVPEANEDPQSAGGEVTERISDFSSLGPSFFYPGETHGPVLANLINDDKSIEQVRVVECVKVHQPKEMDPKCDGNSRAGDFAPPAVQQPAYRYEHHPAKFPESDGACVNVPDVQDHVTESQRPSNESEAVYTDLSHSVVNLQTAEGQMLQRHFTDESQSVAQYSAVQQVTISQVKEPDKIFEENSNSYSCNKTADGGAEVSQRVAMDVGNYFNNGDSFSSTTEPQNYNAAQRMEPATESYTQMVYSAAFDNSAPTNAQSAGSFEIEQAQKAAMVDVQMSTKPEQSENFIAPPLFALSHGGDVDTLGHSNIPVVSAMPGFAPYQGGLLESLQSQGSLPPTSHTRDSDVIATKTFQTVPVSSSNISGVAMTSSFNSMVDSRACNAGSQSQGMEITHVVPSNEVQNTPVSQPHLIPVQNTTLANGNQHVSHSQNSSDSHVETFAGGIVGASAQTVQIAGHIAHQDDVSARPERLKATPVSETANQSNETDKNEQTLVQSQAVAPLLANQNPALIASQSVISQQIAGSRLVLQNGSLVQSHGSLVQSHVAQSALSTNIQQGLIVNNAVQSPQIQAAKSHTYVSANSQAVVSVSPNTGTKTKRKERSQQAVSLQTTTAQQLPVVVNQPRLSLPVSHTLFPQQNLPSQNNAIIIQNPSGLQTLQPQGGIQIVNNQGTLQAVQPPSGIQVLTNQGLQTIQPQGGLQVVQNVQDGVSLLGSQPPQGGYQIIQTPAGIQMVPVQPSFQPIQSGIPMVPGYQPQNMGPISMINMNITNNLQAPMQTFQTNLPTIQGSMPMLSGPIQPLGSNIVPSQVFQCMNQSGELVAVTPLFQIPVEQVQVQPAPIQGNILAQNVQLNQGLVHIPLNVGSHSAAQLQSVNIGAMSTTLQQQQHSDSPLNMVCKENPLTHSSQERDDDEEKIDVIHT